MANWLRKAVSFEKDRLSNEDITPGKMETIKKIYQYFNKQKQLNIEKGYSEEDAYDSAEEATMEHFDLTYQDWEFVYDKGSELKEEGGFDQNGVVPGYNPSSDTQ